MRKPLPDFWWVRKAHTRYVCPLLMTLSCWIYRARGKNARWYSTGERIGSAAIVLIGNGEAPCLFPRSWIIAECNFRNWWAQTTWKLKRAMAK